MTSSKIAGSLEPMKTSVTKWHHGIDASGLSQLQALAKDINKTVDATVKHVARGKIKVGKLLLEARAMFIEDQAFGKWRKENTLVQSKQHAHYLMKVAERFHDAPKLIDGANYSVLQELVLAEQKDIEWVEARIEAGDPPTMVETRERVKKGTSKKALKMSGKMVHVPIESPNTPMNLLVQMGLTRRIQEVVKQGIKGIEGDFIILGMDPDPQCPCHFETLNAIRDYWLEFDEFDADETRAVRDSHKRIVKEFENWNTR